MRQLAFGAACAALLTMAGPVHAKTSIAVKNDKIVFVSDGPGTAPIETYTVSRIVSGGKKRLKLEIAYHPIEVAKGGCKLVGEKVYPHPDLPGTLTATCPLAGVRALQFTLSRGSDHFTIVNSGSGAVPALPATVYGKGAADSLFGGRGRDKLFGGEGNDILDGRENADVMNGGPGVDEADYRERLTPVRVTLDGEANDGTPGSSPEGDNALVENVHGGNGADVLVGDGAANRFEGADGDDILRGGDGDDWIRAGNGIDQLFGDAGDDYLHTIDIPRTPDAVISCGEGTDRLFFDDTDTSNADCESTTQYR